MGKDKEAKNMGAVHKIDKTNITGLTKHKKETLKKFVGKSSSKIDWIKVRDEYRNESN